MKKQKSFPNKISRAVFRPMRSRTAMTLFAAMLVVVHVQRFRKREIGFSHQMFLPGEVKIDLGASFNRRKILSENIQNVSSLKNASNGTAFYSMIPTNKLILASNQQAWVQISMPPEWKQRKLSKLVTSKFSRRRSLLKHTCKRDGLSESNLWLENAQLITAPESHVVVCYAQKAGSTSWHKLIYNLRHQNDDSKKWSNEGHIENRKFVKDLSHSTRAVLTVSTDVTRILCVRHPFARLISGWHSKFNRNFVDNVGNLMFKSMPDLVRYVNKTVPHDKDHVISFEDFALYLAENKLDKVDAHFKSVDQLCRPCAFPYDFVVKAETAPKDLWLVLRRFNATMDHFLVHNANAMTENEISIKNYTRNSSPETVFEEIVRHFFIKLPTRITRALIELYHTDFVRFGYTFDMQTLRAGGLK